ncbi:MAG: adenosylhomocysteinase [Candidatus Methanomethylicota archaeon]|jgi:adenosylhomocysteinase|uniref:Adenosylhomocysteinase n=1 Tax=Thermoproteota archaeon TaxID=2056631 RepID=A0A520KGW9_9CREN|nr:MAG: adenosylhomocysteinase [Candidatus Verstraetearchaeota archaeon]TDA40470.1 MAG: adenosylhomocysteinase [Candidatus Verstraetearchaeota archaeon]
MEYIVKDIKLAEKGKKSIEWAENHMPVLMEIRKRFQEEKPLKDIKIGACLHVTKETAVLIRTLKAGGADIALTASNPLSTQDDVAAALASEGIRVYAIKGETREEYYKFIEMVLENEPIITIDDGADLVTTLHKGKGNINTVIGGTEETTTGVLRLKAMADKKLLKYPIIAVNNAETKWDFDNIYGTGQSTIDGILRATNILIAGKKFVVAGYGHCGKGIAIRAKGMGARVIVTEVDPIKALKAVMDGFDVMPMREAAKHGDIFVTATGNKNVIRREHIELMKDGAILANAGHFNVEIDINALEEMKKEKRKINDFTDEYILNDGRKIYLLAEGRLVNLVAAEGHPSEVMDMSFSNQALCIEYIVKNYHKLEPKVYDVPREIDEEIARLKLKKMGIEIDTMTEEQINYIKTWWEGT